MGKEEQPQEIAPIQPQPVEMNVDVVPVAVMTDAGADKIVMFAFITPVGQNFYFMEAEPCSERFLMDVVDALEDARPGITQNIIKALQERATGIVIPDAADIAQIRKNGSRPGNN